MKRECISGTISRRTFIERGFAVLGVGTPGLCALAEMARHPLVGAKLPKWEKGHFRINMLFTGKSETSFLVFPDSTSMLIDCGDYEYRGPKAVKQLPDASRRAGEWTARYVLDQNPNGKMVDYFMLSHYHSDHAGALPFSAGRSANGKFSLSGIGQAMEFLAMATLSKSGIPTRRNGRSMSSPLTWRRTGSGYGASRTRTCGTRRSRATISSVATGGLRFRTLRKA